MKYKRTRITVAVSLTQKELADRGHDLAKAETEFSDEEKAKSESARAFKETLDALSARITDLSVVILNGSEEREVEVLIVPDFGSNRILFTSAEDGAILRERAMTDAERQGDLPMGNDDPDSVGPSELDTDDGRA